MISEPTDQPWGLRDYEAVDLEGRQWNFSQHLHDTEPRDWARRRRNSERVRTMRRMHEALAALSFCYVTTTGRRSGRPHRIEIWFAAAPDSDTIYLLAGGRDRSDWVRNLAARPECTVEIGADSYRGTARLVEDTSEENRRDVSSTRSTAAPTTSSGGATKRYRSRSISVRTAARPSLTFGTGSAHDHWRRISPRRSRSEGAPRVPHRRGSVTSGPTALHGWCRSGSTGRATRSSSARLHSPKTAALSDGDRVAVDDRRERLAVPLSSSCGTARGGRDDRQGVVEEYALAANRYFGEEQGPAWVAQFPEDISMVRIAVRPEHVTILDFGDLGCPARSPPERMRSDVVTSRSKQHGQGARARGTRSPR